MELNFPKYDIKIKSEEDKHFVWDIIRKKWIVLQAEEWVRQNLIWYLADKLNYPKSLMSVEKQIKVNKLKKRYDLVMHTPQLKTILLVECKAPDVKITQATFNQIGQYNIALKVPYLLVTNGLNHFFCEINHEEKTYEFHKEILNWQELLTYHEKTK